MNLKDEVYSELAYEVFAQHELDLFFRMKKGESVHGNKYNRVLKELLKIEIPEPFAKQFLDEQFRDMRAQIREQAVAG